MEKDKEYGVPWLRKRVSFGTWVKDRVREEGYIDLHKWLDQLK